MTLRDSPEAADAAMRLARIGTMRSMPNMNLPLPPPPPGEPDESIIEMDPAGKMLKNLEKRGATPVPLVEPGLRILAAWGQDNAFILSVVSSDLSKVYARVMITKPVAKSLTSLLRLLAPVVDLTGELPDVSDGQTEVDPAPRGGSGAEESAGHASWASAGAAGGTPTARGAADGGSSSGPDSVGRHKRANRGARDDAAGPTTATG